MLMEEVAEVESGDTTDAQANIIVREMEQHHQLMEDNPEAEERRRYEIFCGFCIDKNSHI